MPRHLCAVGESNTEWLAQKEHVRSFVPGIRIQLRDIVFRYVARAEFCINKSDLAEGRRPGL